MSWLFVATLAQFILGTAAVFDKFFLQKRALDAVSYTFWIGVLGIVAAFFIPFGVGIPQTPIIIFSLFSGFIFITSLFFGYKALENNEASKALPFIGGISPVATLILNSVFFHTPLERGEIWGFLFLALAALVLFLVEKGELRGSLLGWGVLSAFFLGLSNVTEKAIFNNTNFLTGFFWIKLGGFIFVILWLFLPRLKKRIFQISYQSHSKHKVTYFANRAYAGVGSFLVIYAVSLTHPALVDATQSLRYIIIFFASWIFLREHFKGKALWVKTIATFLVLFGFIILSLVSYIHTLPPLNPDRHINWGVTFSQKFSNELGLDWKANYLAVLDELRPQKLRLVAYWDEVEPQLNQFDFTDLDWQMNEAQKRNISVLLAMGRKLPRWPECHVPEWTKTMAKDTATEENDYIKEVINHYRSFSVITAWQIENEPFFMFGPCRIESEEELGQEISIIKNIDPSRPVVVTDSGELGLWYKAAGYGDVFGTTMYRKVYPTFIGSLLGVVEYPLPPSFFRIKEKLIRWMLGDYNKRFIVVELQGEPWEPTSLKNISIDILVKDFSPEYFKETIDYAKSAGFDEYYLWGVEWWYFMKTKYGDARYWDFAKDIFDNKKITDINR